MDFEQRPLFIVDSPLTLFFCWKKQCSASEKWAESMVQRFFFGACRLTWSNFGLVGKFTVRNSLPILLKKKCCVFVSYSKSTHTDLTWASQLPPCFSV